MKQLIVLFSLLTISLSAAAQVDSTEEAQTTLATTISVAATPAATADSLWDSANTAYINGDYNGAKELYMAIIESGQHSDKLYYNLGNAHYKLGDMAGAILYYQKGLVITPNDKDISYNLAIAQAQIKDQINQVPEFFMHRIARNIGHLLDCTGWSILSLVALVVLFGAALLFLLASQIKRRKVGFTVGLIAAIIFAISSLYALWERSEILEHNRGVVMSQSISIKSSPDHSATDLFMLHSGTTVSIIRQIDNWYEISIADGKSGWIESRRVEKI